MKTVRETDRSKLIEYIYALERMMLKELVK